MYHAILYHGNISGSSRPGHYNEVALLTRWLLSEVPLYYRKCKFKHLFSLSVSYPPLALCVYACMCVCVCVCVVCVCVCSVCVCM